MNFNKQDANALKSILASSGWMTSRAADLIQSHIKASGPMETFQFTEALQRLIDAANATLDEPDRIDLDMWSLLMQNTDRDIWEHPYDLLTLAQEGVCSYWFDEDADDITGIRVKYFMGQIDSVTFKHEIRTDEWVTHTVTLKDILRACSMVLANPELFHTDVHATLLKTMFTDDWDYDADTADYIFQLAAFGEIVYG